MKRIDMSCTKLCRVSFFLMSAAGLLAPQSFADTIPPALVTADDFVSEPLWHTGTLQATLVSNQGSTIHTSYQSSYEKQLTANGKTVVWPGAMYALFVDEHGRLREDSDGDAQLDGAANCSGDLAVELSFSQSEGVTFKRSNGSSCAVTGADKPIGQLQPIWDAQTQLSHINPDQQRGYSSEINGTATGGRYIFSAINGAKVDFDSGAINGSNYRYLNVGSEIEADAIVDFIRGKEGITGFRNRTIDGEPLRLGDIVNSIPLVVDGPVAGYDVRYNDASYTAFKTKYADRRRMVYVGANDGLLHAFNGGFWSSEEQEFKLATGANETAHPLGSEIWAYAPENLLPHLKWLTATDYSHVYYVDGAPQAFDVNIFPSDEVHPNGWGTILVVAMRLGGGDVQVDGITATFSSAYIILDITDPESAPEIIAEVTDDNLDFTTSKPALMKKRVPGQGNDWFHPSTNEWQLVFGSGPDDLEHVASRKSSYSLFQYDLVSNTLSETAVSDSSRYVGALNSTDWDDDFQDDMLYFGTVKNLMSGSSRVELSGELKRAEPGTSLNISTVLDANQPIYSQPITVTDDKGAYWVYVGAGILSNDIDVSSLADRFFYGIKEPVSSGSLSLDPVSLSDLVDVTDVQVFKDGSLVNAPTFSYGTDPSYTPTTFDELLVGIEGNSGWLIDLDKPGEPTGTPGTRVLTPAQQLGSTIFFSAYEPEVGKTGSGTLFAINYKTGTADASSILGQNSAIMNNAQPLSSSSIDVGEGRSLELTFILAPGDVPAVLIPTSVGGLSVHYLTMPVIAGGRKSWRILPL
ncbi:MAG: hypothetical protein KUG72_03795 [Pseudomonadales bacterium]|nr:hypothetical protein [Pseudomonadales bacterium]